MVNTFSEWALKVTSERVALCPSFDLKDLFNIQWGFGRKLAFIQSSSIARNFRDVCTVF